MDEADVELQRLHDRRDVVALDPHEAPHARRVDGARPHPLLDAELRHLLWWQASFEDEHRRRGLDGDEPAEHVLMGDRQQLVSLEFSQLSDRRRHPFHLPPGAASAAVDSRFLGVSFAT